MNISILCPTRARPKFCFDLVESAFKTAHDPSKLEFIFYTDDDDSESDMFFENTVFYLEDEYDIDVEKQVIRIEGSRIVLSEMWNRCWEKASADVFFHCGDDIRFRTKNWDKVILDSFDKLDDKIAFIYGNDGYHNEGIDMTRDFGTHGFIHRNWTDTVGYFVPPYFSSDYNDTWLNDVATQINRRYVAPIYTEHLHPVLRKYHWDKTHKERLIRHKEDNVKELYLSDKMKTLRQEWANKLQNFIDNYKGVI